MAKTKSKSEDKVLKLSELVFGDGTPFVPTEKELQVVSEVTHLFRQVQQARDQNFQYFDGLNLIEYIEDSVRRFNTNVDERDGIEDWQAGVHVHFTRNKVLSILGKIMAILPMASFIGRGDEDSMKGTLLTNIYEYTEEIDDYDEFMTHLLLESIVKGTGIGYEDIDIQEKTFRDVKGVGDDITVTEKKEKTTRLYGSIVPLEEFYPSSVSVRKIKDMPYCFWRKTVPYSKFMDIYGHLAKSQVVSEKRSFGADDSRPYYYDFMDNGAPDGSVEIIRFYDKMNDQYVIIANGVWLNPINTTSGAGSQEEVSPMPWNHKDLPFWEVKFDFFGDFFYGKSLPDRLKSMQDVLNVLTNMLLDQSFLTIFPPLLTNGTDSIEDDYIRPGRRTPVDTQGLPINQAFQVLDMKTPSGWHQYILDYTKQIMEESSLDRVSSGIAGQGDRTTAQEIQVAASGVAAMMQMFARMVNTGIKRKAILKAANIIQFGFNTEAPILRQVMGEGSSQLAKDAFTVIQLDNTVLTGGKRGIKLIEFYKDKASLPTRSSIKARAAVGTVESGKQVEIVAIPPAYLRNFQFDVKIGLNPHNSTSMDVEKALEIEKIKAYMTFFPDLVNKQELAAELAEKYGDDPTKVLNADIFNPPQQQAQPAVPGQQDPTQPPQVLPPQVNTANNIRRAMMGGQPRMP